MDHTNCLQVAIKTHSFRTDTRASSSISYCSSYQGVRDRIRLRALLDTSIKDRNSHLFGLSDHQTLDSYRLETQSGLRVDEALSPAPLDHPFFIKKLGRHCVTLMPEGFISLTACYFFFLSLVKKESTSGRYSPRSSLSLREVVSRF